jgi:hypothetical protein
VALRIGVNSTRVRFPWDWSTSVVPDGGIWPFLNTKRRGGVLR